MIHRVVLEGKADFYYLGRGIGGIRALLETNDVRRRTHMVILLFSIAYNLLAVGVCDEMGRLLGAITVDDVLDRMLPADWRQRRRQAAAS